MITRSTVWRFIIITPIIFLVFLALGALNCLHVGPQTRTLRDVAMALSTRNPHRTVEGSLGFFPLSLARLGSRFIELPEEVRPLLSSVRGVEVSVHETFITDLPLLLKNADTAMARKNYTRICGVLQEMELVAVYSSEENSADQASFSILVINDGKLIIASARGDLQPLLNLAIKKAGQHAPNNPLPSGL